MSAATDAAEPGPRSLWATLWARFGALVHELGKFGVVGGVSFVVDTVLFNLLRYEGLGPIPAKIGCTIVSASVAFVGNRLWTWRHRPRSRLHREYGLYFLFNLVGLGIALGCLTLSHYVLGAIWPHVFQTVLADNIAAQGFGLVLGTLFRFHAYRSWVFPDTGGSPSGRL